MESKGIAVEMLYSDFVKTALEGNKDGICTGETDFKCFMRFDFKK